MMRWCCDWKAHSNKNLKSLLVVLGKNMSQLQVGNGLNGLFGHDAVVDFAARRMRIIFNRWKKMRKSSNL
jgi:hypothetical protein